MVLMIYPINILFLTFSLSTILFFGITRRLKIGTTHNIENITELFDKCEKSLFNSGNKLLKSICPKRDITLLKQLSIYDLIDFLEQDILINEEYTAFMSSLTAIEIVSILKLIIPELDTFLHSTSIADIISELDTSITYQEILSHYITTEVLNTYPQYIKKEGSF